VGLLLVTTELSTIFWLLGLLSFISVGLMAVLLPNRTPLRPSVGKMPIQELDR